MTAPDQPALPALPPPLGAALLLGVPVDDVTMNETIDIIDWLVADGRRNRRAHQVVTVNVDFVVNAGHDPALAGILRRSALSIPDGMPIVWGARALGTPLRTRVAGADLVAELAERSLATGARIALFGAAPGVADRAATLLRQRFPGIDLIADAGPSFRHVSELDTDALQPLRDARPDICCVAFGNPKQELFIDRFQHELGIPVMIGVGGSLDFLVGEQHRAPMWMQRTGLEWVHRAASDPKRLAMRYVRDAFVFLPALARQVVVGRGSRRRGVMVIAGDDATGAVEVDLSAVERVDNAGAGRLVALLRQHRLNATPVAIVGYDRNRLRHVPGLAELVSEA